MTLKYGIFCLLGLFIAVLLALKNYEMWTGPVSAVPEKGAPKNGWQTRDPSDSRGAEG